MVHPDKKPKLSIRQLIPSMVTVLALCAGLTSMRFGIEGRYGLAVIMILLAGFLDGLDGRVARLLRGTTRFGAELDSLADFVNFGVAPALLVYVALLEGSGPAGWLSAMILAICCGLRLARFNVMSGDKSKPAWMGAYFVGVPAPAAGALALLPLFLDFLGLKLVHDLPFLVAVYLILIGLLAVSAIPTFSLKKASVKREWVLPLFIVFAAFVGLLLTNPWLAMSLASLLYLSLLPVSYRAFKRKQAEEAAKTAVAAED
jgi:CDP-diacylglycerol--serine O-phosphatidyltransferase